jgi:hypothetical protein
MRASPELLVKRTYVAGIPIAIGSMARRGSIIHNSCSQSQARDEFSSARAWVSGFSFR